VVVVYGLSYFPSATLAQGNEVEEVGDLNKEGIDPDAEDAEADAVGGAIRTTSIH
jgi:hypothetical protein